MNSMGDNAETTLRGLVERIERVQEDIDAAKDDLKDIFAEAKADGFDTKTLRKVLREKKRKEKDPASYDEETNLEVLYMKALGII